MLIGCLVPFALIFILPLFGVGSGVTLAVFIVLMFVCHLAMMGGHGHGSHGHTNHDKHNHTKHKGDSP
jgi:hypothetical protein